MSLKEIKQFADLYGARVILPELNKKYYFVSYCKNTIPKPGSPTKCTNCFTLNKDLNIEKVVLHKNGNITVKVESIGYLQYFN